MTDQAGSLLNTIKIENPINAEQQILELCTKNPDGINDVMLQQELPQVSAQQRLAALNRLLSLGKLDLLKSAQLGIVIFYIQFKFYTISFHIFKINLNTYMKYLMKIQLTDV